MSGRDGRGTCSGPGGCWAPWPWGQAWPLCCQLPCDLGGDRSPDRGPVFSPGRSLLPCSASCSPAQGVSPGRLLLAGETAGEGGGSGRARVGLCSFTRLPPQILPQPRTWGLLIGERIPPWLLRPHPGSGGWPIWRGGCRILGGGLLREARGQTSSCRSPPRWGRHGVLSSPRFS